MHEHLGKNTRCRTAVLTCCAMSSNTACSHSQWFLTYVSSVYKQDRKLHYEATCQSELRSTTSEPKGVGTLSNLSGLLRACELSGCNHLQTGSLSVHRQHPRTFPKKELRCVGLAFLSIINLNLPSNPTSITLTFSVENISFFRFDRSDPRWNAFLQLRSASLSQDDSELNEL